MLLLGGQISSFFRGTAIPSICLVAFNDILLYIYAPFRKGKKPPPFCWWHASVFPMGSMGKAEEPGSRKDSDGWIATLAELANLREKDCTERETPNLWPEHLGLVSDCRALVFHLI